MNNSHDNIRKTWKDLNPTEVTHFYQLGSKRSERYGEMAHSVWGDFAKYLSAANTGAAAGLFFLLRATNSDFVFWAFCLFALGAGFVCLAYLFFTSWTHQYALGWAKDFESVMRNEMTLGQLDLNNLARQRSRKWKIARKCLLLSFILLIAGGVLVALELRHPSKTLQKVENR